MKSILSKLILSSILLFQTVFINAKENMQQEAIDEKTILTYVITIADNELKKELDSVLNKPNIIIGKILTDSEINEYQEKLDSLYKKYEEEKKNNNKVNRSEEEKKNNNKVNGSAAFFLRLIKDPVFVGCASVFIVSFLACLHYDYWQKGYSNLYQNYNKLASDYTTVYNGNNRLSGLVNSLNSQKGFLLNQLENAARNAGNTLAGAQNSDAEIE